MKSEYYVDMKISFGDIVVGLYETGEIFGLWFVGQRYFPKTMTNRIKFDDDFIENMTIPVKVKDSINDVLMQFRYYDGGRFENFDLNLKPEGTEFQRHVWDILLTIPYGETMTYGEIADIICMKLNKPAMSAQAVGGAVGRNPLTIIIPCHRVVGKDGSMTGYAGGIDKKVALLKHEKTSNS